MPDSERASPPGGYTGRSISLWDACLRRGGGRALRAAAPPHAPDLDIGEGAARRNASSVAIGGLLGGSGIEESAACGAAYPPRGVRIRNPADEAPDERKAARPAGRAENASGLLAQKTYASLCQLRANSAGELMALIALWGLLVVFHHASYAGFARGIVVHVMPINSGHGGRHVKLQERHPRNVRRYSDGHRYITGKAAQKSSASAKNRVQLENRVHLLLGAVSLHALDQSGGPA